MWPAPNVWVFIAQFVKHCSANAEAISSNPVEFPKTFFGLICNFLNNNYYCDDNILKKNYNMECYFVAVSLCCSTRALKSAWESELPGKMLSHKILTNLSLSGRVCSWKKPNACMSSWVTWPLFLQPLPSDSSCFPPFLPICDWQKFLQKSKCYQQLCNFIQRVNIIRTV